MIKAITQNLRENLGLLLGLLLLILSSIGMAKFTVF